MRGQRIGREGTGVAQAETATQLYAVIEAGEAALDRLAAALSAAEIASLLIAPPPGGTLDAAAARPLVEAAQRQGVAALIADDARLARTLRADGVHLGIAKDPAGAYAEARSILGQGGIVGVDPGISRHDAMTLAEDGADYIAFGAPPHLKDRDKARDAPRRADRLVGGDLPGALRRLRRRDARGSRGARAARAPTSSPSGCLSEPRRRPRAISWPASPRRSARPRRPAEGRPVRHRLMLTSGSLALAWPC